jgi:hypothetical protein
MESIGIHDFLKHCSVFRLRKDPVDVTVNIFYVTLIKLAGANKPERAS